MEVGRKIESGSDHQEAKYHIPGQAAERYLIIDVLPF